jgi:hypothetical protein
MSTKKKRQNTTIKPGFLQGIQQTAETIFFHKIKQIRWNLLASIHLSLLLPEKSSTIHPVGITGEYAWLSELWGTARSVAHAQWP